MSYMNGKSDFADKRKDSFIKKRFQTTIVLYYLLIITVCSSLTGFFLYSRLLSELNFTMYMGHSSFKDTWEIFRLPLLNTAVSGLLITILMALLVTILIAFFINRQCRRLSTIASGDFTEESALRLISSRPKEFRTIAKTITDIQQDTKDKKALIEKILSMMSEDVENTLSESAGQKIEKSSIEKLSDHERELQEIINFYVIDRD